MNLHTDTRLTKLGILHGTTSRPLGNMRLADNTNTLFTSLGLEQTHIARFKQTHSDKIISLSSLADIQALQTTPLPEADAWILCATGIGAAILTADCVPLIVWDEKAHILGLAHCGWRGVVQQLPAKTVQYMRAAGAKGKISAWAGPHIQACCFEVQQEVAAQFEGCVQYRADKQFVNLNQAIKQQLLQEKISPADIVFDLSCTCCQPEQFFSFRRQHRKDAMLTFVYKP